MIPNYLQARSKCLANSEIYGICCFDECEALYGQLERSIAGSDADPQRVGSLVAGLSSSTVHGPRNLSQALLARLGEISSAHGGKVLLHSRLFEQWMHQAFPRECPYPHLAGAVTSLHPVDWAIATGFEHRIDHAGESTKRK